MLARQSYWMMLLIMIMHSLSLNSTVSCNTAFLHGLNRYMLRMLVKIEYISAVVYVTPGQMHYLDILNMYQVCLAL